VIAVKFQTRRIGVVTPKGVTIAGLREAPSRLDWIHVPSHDLGSQDLDQFDAILVLTDEIQPALVRFVCDEVARLTIKPQLGVCREPERLAELVDVALPSPQSRRDVLLMAQRITRIVYSIEDDPSGRGAQWRQLIGVVAIVATVPAVVLGIQTGDAALAAETAGAVVTTVSAILCGHGIRSRRSARGRQ
jgi:hypothetical protein|tara:strand:+ start:467 stop:1036 length:570 start_codon:yes stop_codon:yes gene_type:complete